MSSYSENVKATFDAEMSKVPKSCVRVRPARYRRLLKLTLYFMRAGLR